MKKVIKFEVAIEYESDSDFDTVVLENRLQEAIEFESKEGALDIGARVSADWVKVKAIPIPIPEDKPETKIVWALEVFMDTDDDAEIFCEGRSYCYYANRLDISEFFPTQELAVQYFRQNIQVGFGHKASEFTHNWLVETANKLEASVYPENISGNQTYAASLTQKEVPV